MWFAADLHFGHKGIIDHCGRPFTDVDEMDQALVDNWNDYVQPTDTVYLLGDIAFHNYERIGQLNGKLLLVPGNHDHERMEKIEPWVNKVLDEVHYLKVDAAWRFVLCHYPFEAWRRGYKYHLHGHCHGTGAIRKNRMDVGFDATRKYRPMHIDEIKEVFNAQQA